MQHPKEVGDRTTLATMLALQAVGYSILVPFGENTRYDLVLDDGAQLARVQCKTGRLRKGAVVFAVCSTYGHHRKPGEVKRAYKGEIDYFAVHCPETDGVYLIPIADLPMKTTAYLRVSEPMNNQKLGIRWADDYRIGTVKVAARTDEARVVPPFTGGLRESCGAR